MPSRRDALLPSMALSMVYIDNYFFLIHYLSIDLAMPFGRKNDVDILLRNKEMEETDSQT